MEVSEEAKEYLVEKGYDPKFGARPLNRAIQKYLEDKIAEELLKSDLKTNDKFTVDVDKEADELIIHIVPSEEPKVSKKSKEPEK
jgi:ATP-dependent Clp protease ATP-binding subunit ClpC